MFAQLNLPSFGLVALAGLLGAVIGTEREFADKPAGLRTHIFAAAGSALLVLLSETALQSFHINGSEERIEGDPIRVIQAIIVGNSFLGAGTIVHHRGDGVEGLTTAASIFLTAGIGIAVALRRIWLAAETSLLALVVLVAVNWIERHWLGKQTKRSDRQSGTNEA